MNFTLYLLLFLIVSLSPILIKKLIKKKIIINSKIVKTLSILTIVSISFLILTYILESYNVYWNGFNSFTKIALFTCILSSTYYSISKKNNYALGTFLVPGIFITLFSLFVYSNYKEIVIEETNEFRLEKYTGGFMYRCCPYPTLFIKNGIFEHKYLKKGNQFELNDDLDKIKKNEIEQDENIYWVNFIMINGDSNKIDYVISK